MTPDEDEDTYYTSRNHVDEAIRVERMKADMEKAMGPRQNPLHPIFRYHNCAYCQDGVMPCRKGNYSQCDNPRARND